jgi:Pentapeptide repeats (9 copies)/Pentapeptide repeats (8 copies)
MDFPDSKASEILDSYARGERNFRGIVLCGAYFVNPDINNPISYDLSAADFSAGNFTNTQFGPANLSSSSFRGSIIDEASFTGADMQKVNLRQVLGGMVDLSRVNLEGAYLNQACISHSSFRESNLITTDLSHAAIEFSDLQEANFQRSNLRYFSMFESHIDKANFKDAFVHSTVFGISYNPGLIYPDGRIDEGCFRTDPYCENTEILEAELLTLYREFYDSFVEDTNIKICEHEGCSRNHIQNNRLCKKHYFEMIQKKECPFKH